MKCDKLMKEAFEGIEFRYKLDDTLEELGNQKLSSKQLEGFLVGKGVSPKEIKQSGVLKGFEDDNRVMTGKEWLERSGDQRLSTTTVPTDELSYDTYTLGRKGTDNETYNETLTTIKKPMENAPSTPHFSNEISTPKESLLGWRRTHVDEINGKKTLVLNELQSDWAQTERAGRGTFESNSLYNTNSDEYTILPGTYYDVQDLIEIEYKKGNNTKADALEMAIGIDEQDKKRVKLKTLVSLLGKDWVEESLSAHTQSTKVADFPMTELKHNQFQIVGAIDEALKQGIDTVAIPIQRENELAGTAGVTKFYDSLNKKILPEIRKKLEKQGMRIKVGKEDYSEGDIKDFEEFRKYFAKELEAFDVQHRSRTMDEMLEFEIDTGKLLDNLSTFEEFAKEYAYSTEFKQIVADKLKKNTLHTLTIEEIPGTKVKWDVYALLGGLGLASQTKSEANTRKVNMGTNDNASEATVKQYFADIESSGGNYNAFNKGSKAYGKYQITPIMMKDLGITMKDLNTPTKQEAIMSKLIPKYQSRLEQFDLPVNKENMFVLHNLGMTGGIRVIKGNPTSEDISNMKNQLHGKPKRTDNEIINNYAVTYNLDK